MRTDDPNSFKFGSTHGVSGNLWNYGAEIWCNLEGQYITMVADLAHLNSQTYEMSICSLGVMGAKYDRATPLQTIFNVQYKETQTILVQNI